MTQFVSHTNSYISHSGFPKMGTSSLHAYFKCGGLKSTHYYYCNDDNTIPNKDRLCVSCIKESVKAGLPPLTQCDNADMYAQLDDGVYFPQIELLEDIVQEYPNATFFLTFRNMEKWYNSLLNGYKRIQLLMDPQRQHKKSLVNGIANMYKEYEI